MPVSHHQLVVAYDSCGRGYTRAKSFTNGIMQGTYPNYAIGEAFGSKGDMQLAGKRRRVAEDIEVLATDSVEIKQLIDMFTVPWSVAKWEELLSSKDVLPRTLDLLEQRVAGSVSRDTKSVRVLETIPLVFNAKAVNQTRASQLF